MRDIEERALRLQWLQEQHDQHYHSDIYVLSRADNLTHMTMHMAKYLGKLVEVQQLEPKAVGHLTRHLILTDMLIVLTSCANRLNISLGGEYAALVEMSTKHDFFFANSGLFAQAVIAGASVASNAPEGQNFICQCLRYVGRMSKALEALDHMESYDSRVELERAVLALFSLTLVNHCQTSPVTFVDAMASRLNEIEANHFLHAFKPKYNHGYVTKG